MEDQDKPDSQAVPMNVGDQLRAAREAAGLSRSDVAARTRVAERHLTAIEENRFSALAAPTYAVGFSRAYARAVGLDESEIARKVRRQLDMQSARPAPAKPSFEPGDPARVPPSRVAWIAGLLVVAAIGLLLVYWNSFLSPEGNLPDLLPDATQSAAAPAPANPRPAPPAQAQGPVVLTAMAPNVWLKITDASGTQLFQRELAQGESYTVPAQAQGPQLRTGRPDALQITLGGRPLPLLSDKPQVMSGIALTPAALLARAGGGTNASPSPAAPSPAATAASVPHPRPSARHTTAPSSPLGDDALDSRAPAPSPRAPDGISTPSAPAQAPVSTTSR